MKISDFLKARIAEDEQAARRAAGKTAGQWRESGSRVFCNSGMITTAWSDDAEHIARHDPARVLAECEAKRKLIDTQFDYAAIIDGEWACCHDAMQIEAGECPINSDGEFPMLILMAEVYADHPDYQREWAA